MSIRRFIAPTARQAMKEIRDELGADAMILSNRKTEYGVEIVALANGDIAHLTASAVTQKTEWPEITADEWTQSVEEDHYMQPMEPLPREVKAAQHAKPSSQPINRPGQALQFQPKTSGQPAVSRHPGKLAQPKSLPPTKPFPQSEPLPLAEPFPQPEPLLQARPLPQAKPLPQAQAVRPLEAQPAQPIVEQENIISEIKSIGTMLRQQFAALYWNDVQLRDPQRAGLLRKMLNAGFSTLLAHQLLDKMPAGKVQGELWIKQVLKRNLQVSGKADDIIEKGGVYALIGPTGVGKTTTTAKLAARAVVRYGADKVALLTTDSYRIAAYEQLKIYGKILGVAVHAVKDTDDLRLTLSALRHKHLVLIDTVGMGQRDERVCDQNEMFDAVGVKCLLLLNATSGGETLEDVVRMYRSNKVIGCIATKLDEAVNLGTMLDVAVRHRLMMHYMTNGQRVPEDLHLINADYLLHRALKHAEEKTPFTLRELDFPLLMAEEGPLQTPIKKAMPNNARAAGAGASGREISCAH
ncbi:MAG: flagellar biosynthesis protein FlhF [Gallionella sp.]|nr:flagellar biosynthesis protein FlhF [Gallionella sp.]